MNKTIFMLMVIALFSKMLGFIRDLTLSYFYGVSNISDAYLISLTIPNVILGLIGAGIITNYIPMYNRIEGSNGLKAGYRFTSNLVNILMVFFTIISLGSFVFAGYLVKLFASGFDNNTLELAIKFTRISIISIYFNGLLHVFKGFLQIKGNYITPALIGIPMNLIIILSILVSYKTDVIFLAIGSIIAALSQFALVLYSSFKKGYKYNFIFNLADGNIKKFLFLGLPVVLGISVNQINELVDRTLASQIITGGISALNYANTLIYFVQGIFVTSLVTVFYPAISKMATLDNMDAFKKAVIKTTNCISLLVIPVSVVTMLFAEDIVSLIFERGEFDAFAVTLTSSALFFYSIGMFGIALREVISRAFYALHDTKTPMINASIAVILNILLNIILSKFLGIGGLALATSLSALFGSVLLVRSLRKRIGPFGIKNSVNLILKVTIASIIMGICAIALFNILMNHVNLFFSLIISLTCGVLVYVVLIYFLKIDEIIILIQMIKNHLR
jgi:putative peptidoglycan lipid II flippase